MNFIHLKIIVSFLFFLLVAGYSHAAESRKFSLENYGVREGIMIGQTDEIKVYVADDSYHPPSQRHIVEMFLFLDENKNPVNGLDGSVFIISSVAERASKDELISAFINVFAESGFEYKASKIDGINAPSVILMEGNGVVMLFVFKFSDSGLVGAHAFSSSDMKTLNLHLGEISQIVEDSFFFRLLN